jgi:hypothetical protein
MSPLPFPEELPSSTQLPFLELDSNEVPRWQTSACGLQRQLADFSTQRYFARSVANADEPAMKRWTIHPIA